MSYANANISASSTMDNFHLAAMNIAFDLHKEGVGSFPDFLNKLEQNFWNDGTYLSERVELLRKTVDSYTWSKIQEICDHMDNNWAAEVEEQPHHPHRGWDSPHRQHRGWDREREPVTFQSPLLRKNVRVNRNLLKDFLPEMKWPAVRSAIISRLFRDSSFDARKALEEFSPLQDVSMLDMHNMKFLRAVNLAEDVDSQVRPREAIRLYLKTIPESIVSKLREFPQTLADAQSVISGLASLHRELGRTRNTTGTPLALHAVHDLRPTNFERTSERVTRTKGTYDLSKVNSEEDIERLYELMERMRNVKRSRAEADSDDDEHDDGKKSKRAPPGLGKVPRRRSKRRNQNQDSDDEDRAGVNSMAALNECKEMLPNLVAAMRESNANSGCRYCQGTHLVRACPDLRLDNGSYDQYCTYCGKRGHLVGQPRNPTCPVLLDTICPTCKQAGHTYDFCPQNACKKCGEKGHTSKVCRGRKPGVYAFAAAGDVFGNQLF